MFYSALSGMRDKDPKLKMQATTFKTAAELLRGSAKARQCHKPLLKFLSFLFLDSELTRLLYTFDYFPEFLQSWF